MTAETASCPKLLRDALFGSSEKAEGHLKRTLLSEPALLAGLGAAVAMAPAGRELASQEVAEAIADLLAIDVVDVILGGWRRQHDLRDAARRTVHDSGDRELVGLAKHVVELTEDPTIDVIVDDVLSVTIPVHLSVSGQVDEVVAEVERGRLTKIHSGKVTVTARLKIRNTTITERTCELDATADIPLGGGVSLLARCEVTRKLGGAIASPIPEDPGS
jgi:hypothetical protein